jgi:predicted ATPase
MAQPMEIYRAIRPKPFRNRFDIALGRGLTAFHGRSKELAQLNAALERARGGLHAVAVCGEAGVGKSRLVYEFRRTLIDRKLRWLQCCCSPTAETTPLSPVSRRP